MKFQTAATCIVVGGGCVMLYVGANCYWHVLFGVVLSEIAMTIAHKFLWHGLLWQFHEIHHNHPGMLDWNSQDSLALANGLVFGLGTQLARMSFDVFIGTFLHYVLVLLVHDGIGHGRLGWTSAPQNWHTPHHKDDGISLFSVLYEFVVHTIRSYLTTPVQEISAPNTSLKVCVIGAGVGGLTAAAYLKQHGYQVTVVEKNGEIGGRCADIVVGGHRFDIGASMILVKPEIDKVLSELHVEVPMVRCDPAYSVRFHNDEIPFQFRKPDFERIEPNSYSKYLDFIAECSGRYHVTTSVFFRKYKWWKGLSLHHVFELCQYMSCSLLTLAGRYFKTPQLVAATTFEMAFLGSSPGDLASSIFGVLPFTSATHGVWYPCYGGMGSIPRALATNLSDVRVNSEAEQIFPGLGVMMKDGSFVEAQIVVVNADLPTADHLLPNARPRRTLTYAPSSVNFYWVLKPRSGYDSWTAHTIYMSRSYRPLFESLPKYFDPMDPMFYVHCPTYTDADDKTLRIVALVPIPLGFDLAPVEILRKSIFRRMRMSSEDILHEKVITPMEWQERLSLHRGSILGPEHSCWQMGPLRPKFHYAPGVYRVGAGAHPGTGIPCVMQSGRMVAQEIMSREHSVLDNIRQSKTFAKASWFLTTHDHQKIKDLYAFFRLLDDLVDEAPGGAVGVRLAQNYVDLVTSAKAPRDPRLACVHAMRIPDEIWSEFMSGLRFDARSSTDSRVDLSRYCNQVAGTVGEAVVYALGLPSCHQAARKLGTGLQRINICRDIQKDYKKGRYYISPEDRSQVLADASLMINEGLCDMQHLGFRYKMVFFLAGKCYEAMGYGRNRMLVACQTVLACMLSSW